MTVDQRLTFLNSLSDDHLQMLAHDWALWARDQQWPPQGQWRVWLMVAGRGFGKTRAGAEWVRMKASCGKAGRIALVGETFHDVRQVMIEGASGVLAISPEADSLYIDVLLDFSATPMSQSSQHQLKWRLVVDATTFD